MNSKGEFIRAESSFRNRISSDPNSKFPAQRGRYHLYVSYACPWAHRTLIVRNLKGLEDVITFDVVSPLLDSNGWSFNNDTEFGSTGDTVNHYEFLKQVYMDSNPDYTGRITVPVLYDKVGKVIVNNESSEIIEMFNSEFNEFATYKDLNLNPSELKDKMAEVNDFVYNDINNGVYKCGFAKSQEAYNSNFEKLFSSLDRVENILKNQKYLLSNSLTLSDVRLFTTLVRFDSVYVGHFKCNLRPLTSYPNLWGFTRELYNDPRIKKTVFIEHIKCHYYRSHAHINPTRIVPKGPQINWDEPNDRDRFN